MILLTSAYLPPVQYFTKLYSGVPIVEERADHYVKQTCRSRCIIAAADGPLALTVPVETETGGTSRTAMRDIRISEHGKWRHQHWQAIVSAYDRSAFFAYYADDFENIYRQPFRYLVDFNAALCHLVLDLLDLHPDIRVNDNAYLDADTLRQQGLEVEDFRQTIRPKLPADSDPCFCAKPYFQVFAQRHGFLPNLSMIDLLFNCGPESRIVLKASTIHKERARKKDHS